MKEKYAPIVRLLDAVRRRWLTLVVSRAAVRAGLGVAAVLVVALLLVRLAGRHPLAVAAIAVAAVIAIVAAVAAAFLPLRDRPSDERVARFIEERSPSLDDRLVSAVELISRGDADRTPLAGPMLADAARRADAVDPETVIGSRRLRRHVLRAAAAALLVLAVMVAGRAPGRQAIDAVKLALFPEHVTLAVTPGHARVVEGAPLEVKAQLVGNRAPVDAQLQVGDGEHWRTAPMPSASADHYALKIPAVTSNFKYRVVAGPVTSPIFDVTVARPPRVARIDVEYTYPPDLGLQPRTEEDTGDVYAPAGTQVKLRIHTDRPIASGQLALGHGASVTLSPEAPDVLSGTLQVADDDSYRVAIVDREGLKNRSETEYFIRPLADRPPDVHIVKPAADQSVTRLQEVAIEAQADDDYGIDRMELVYSVRGGPDHVVPLRIPPRAASVTGSHLLYLEDLDVQPGDMVSYYVRARDITRGHRANEARSDIFFLEVRPFEQEFALAESQAMAGSGYTGSIDDLVNAQKQVVVATWKLDKRAQMARTAAPEQDIRTVSRTESDLKTRVEQTSSSFRESTMRDPKRRARGRGAQPDTPKAGESMPEEDSMAAAAAAMGKAVASLDALKTHPALPPEMEALNHLLKAQAQVKRRQIARQQAGAGAAGNSNRNYDISTLFDQELKRAQQTNYETPASSAQKNAGSDTLDKLKDLAKRQDELVRRQQDLAKQRDRLSPEEVRRELEKLTRDQLDLRREAEEMARDAANGGARSAADRAAGDRMKSASDEMQNAAGELRKNDAGQASERAARALDRLREAERQMQRPASGPDEQHRALGDAELESRQIADAEREIASELKSAGGSGSEDTMRRLAGEQEQLAERTRRLQDALKRQAGTPGADAAGRERTASAAEAAREAERQRLADRMQRSAEAMRQSSVDGRQSSVGGRQSGSQQSGGQQSGSQPSAGQQSGSQQSGSQQSGGQKSAGQQSGAQQSAGQQSATPQAGAQPSGGQQAASGGQQQAGGGQQKVDRGSAEQELAQALDKLADRIASANAPRDGESRRLSDQLARAQELKDRLNQLSQEMQKLAREGSGEGKQQGGQQTGSMSGGQKPGGQSGGSQAGGQASGGKNGGGGQSGQGTQGGSSGQGGQSGQSGSSGQGGAGTQPGGTSLPQLRDEYARRLAEAKQLIDQMRREDPSQGHGGNGGMTFEDPGSMTLSAPGTEAFKQDFARWEQLRQQVLTALDTAQAGVSKKLEAQQAKDRLAAGADDKAPAAYQPAVDSYFKALANGKK